MPYVLMLDRPRPARWFSDAGFTRSRSAAVEFGAGEVEQRRSQQFSRAAQALEVDSVDDVETSPESLMAEGPNRNVLRKEARGEFYTGAGWLPYCEDAAVCTGADVLDARLRLEAATGEDITSDKIT